MDERLKEYLNKEKIKYEDFTHDAVFTVEESQKIKKKIPGLYCKCLFLKDSNGKFYLVAMPAEKRLDMKKLRTYLCVRKIHFSSEEELKKEINLFPGSVSIFGAIYAIPGKVKIIIDKDIWNTEKSGFHPNINTSTIVVTRDNLKKFLNSLKDICEKEVLDL